MRMQPLAPVAGAAHRSVNFKPPVAEAKGVTPQRQGLRLMVTNELLGDVWNRQQKDIKTLMVQRSRHYEDLIRKSVSAEKASQFLVSPQQLMMQEFLGTQLSGMLRSLHMNNRQQASRVKLEPTMEMETSLEVFETKPKKIIQVKSPLLELPVQQVNYRKFEVKALKIKNSGAERDINTQAKVDYVMKESLVNDFADLFSSGHMRVDY
jgi:hypothetical protein